MSDTQPFVRAPLFAGAGDDDLRRLAAMAERVQVSAGQRVLRAGDPADALHVVVEGHVALSLHAAGRGDVVIETLGPGDAVGVSWALPHRRWDLDARAMTDVALLHLDAAALRDLMDGDDPLGRVLRHGVTSLLGERLHASRLRLADLYREDRAP